MHARRAVCDAGERRGDHELYLQLHGRPDKRAARRKYHLENTLAGIAGPLGSRRGPVYVNKRLSTSEGVPH